MAKPWWILLALLTACGGEVVVIGGGNAGGGQGGDGQGGEGGTISPSGGGGTAPVCDRTDDTFEMALYAHDESEWGCTLGAKSEEGLFTTEGVVVYADEASLTVDACPPNVDCDAFLATTVDVAAEGLDNLVPLGAFVRVEVVVDKAAGCAHYLLVQNLPEWEGVKSFVPTEQIWLAAGDGGVSGTPGLSLALSPEPLGCSDGPGEDYRLRFTLGAESLVLAMGEEEDWSAQGVGHRARNLRSFDTQEAGGEAFGWWLTTSTNEF